MVWTDVRDAKQAERSTKLAHFEIPANLLPAADELDVSTWCASSGWLTPEELRITTLNAHEVCAEIASGRLSAVTVFDAICKRAAAAQQLLNCVTEVYFAEGREIALERDAYFAAHGKVMGPLHGLPISFKDQFQLPGLDTTMGYISLAGKPATEHSTMVASLLKAGAVPYVKTNVPATLMMGESVNNTFGRTCNPYNRSLTSGGSSGGESALVSFKGSFIGVGTDIGGSIRAPCSITGLFGLRPTHGRVSYHLAGNTYLGQEAIRSAAGPMCRSSADVRLFMKSLVDTNQHEHDPQSLPIPWRTELEVLPKQLTFALAVLGDGNVSPTPPLRRAMEITRKALEAAGHKVVEWAVPIEMRESVEVAFAMWAADGGKDLNRDISASGEPWHPSVAKWGHPDVQPKVPISVYDTWQNQRRRDALATSWLRKWAATGMDALIIPATPFPALKHQTGDETCGTLEYCLYGCLSPLLGLTTAVFPVTTVDQVLDVIPASFKPISDDDARVMAYYESPKNHFNAPVGLQLIGKMYDEERIVAILGEVEKALAAASV